jgi:hypothetical protein
MAVTAPLDSYGLVPEGAVFFIAIAIGLAFGFLLERAGFGSAPKLAAVFYFYDMAVLKVMLTAIVTASVGLWALSAAGVLDLAEIYLVPTNLVPQFVGGLLLGAGFIIGGYCPGTSFVGMATGRVDALVYGLGLMAGLAAFAEVFPAIEGFTRLTDLGRITLPELLGQPRGLLTAALAVLAVAAFGLAAWLERRFAANRPSNVPAD